MRWGERNRRLTDRPSLADVAEGLGISLPEAQALLAEVRAGRPPRRRYQFPIRLRRRDPETPPEIPDGLVCLSVAVPAVALLLFLSVVLR